MSSQVIEDRGHRSRWSDSYCSETPTAQYIIYNIKTLFGNSCRPVKKQIILSCWTCPGVSSSPPPPPKEKNHPQPTQNVSPSNFPSPVLWPRDISYRQSPSTNPVSWTPVKGFTPRSHKQTHVDVIKNTYLKPSYHHPGTTTTMSPKLECDLRYQRIPTPTTKSHLLQNKQEQVFPHQVKNGRVPTQWNRTIHSRTPVRGLTSPSILPPFHWCEEKCSHTFSQETWILCSFLGKHHFIKEVIPINFLMKWCFEGITRGGWDKRGEGPWRFYRFDHIGL